MDKSWILQEHKKKNATYSNSRYQIKDMLPFFRPFYLLYFFDNLVDSNTYFCSFVPGRWQTCSRTCGAGTQQRTVKCRVLLSFAQTVADLPDDECEGVKPATHRPCYRTPCSDGLGEESSLDGEEEEGTREREELHDWEYDGFTECSESCGGGII